MEKTLVIYTFHYFNESVYTFLRYGVFQDENIDFLFVCNNRDIEKDIHIDAIFPKYAKVIIRDNIGFDFGAWSVGALTNDLYKNYKYILFLNCSVLGPYLPQGCNEKWPNIFTSKLNNDVKLVGSTINTMNDIAGRAHVQSYCFCMDKDTFNFLVDKEIFSLTKFKDDKIKCIYDNEIGMSRLIIDSGYNISCLCPRFDNIDYKFRNYPPSHLDNRVLYADPPHPCHYNTQWKSTDLIFIKRNRGYNLTEEDKKLLSICEI
jgi:hypothetical protein